jgi:hypothetical protein
LDAGRGVGAGSNTAVSAGVGSGSAAGSTERLVGIRDEIAQAKLLFHLLTPLLHQAVRRDNQHSLDHLPRQIFLDDQAGLNRLAQTNLIAQQATPPEAA